MYGAMDVYTLSVYLITYFTVRKLYSTFISGTVSL